MCCVLSSANEHSKHHSIIACKHRSRLSSLSASAEYSRLHAHSCSPAPRCDIAGGCRLQITFQPPGPPAWRCNRAMCNNSKRGFPQSHARCLVVRTMGKSGMAATGCSTGAAESTGGTPEEEEEVPLPAPFRFTLPFPFAFSHANPSPLAFALRVCFRLHLIDLTLQVPFTNMLR